MAHAVENMAYQGATPWHGIGVKVSEDLSVEEFVRTAGLEWEVKKEPIALAEDAIRIPDRYALVRSSDRSILDVVGPQFKPVQNSKIVEFYKEFCEAGGMHMDTAGSLNNGRMVWALAKIDEGFTLLGGDRVEGNLLFSSPHQSGKALTIMFTPIRVVCQNTLCMALREYGASEGGFRQHHRREFDPDEAKKVMGLAKERLMDFQSKASFLSSRVMSQDKWDEYMKSLFPQSGEEEPRVWAKFRRARVEMPGAEKSEGTAWHALNTVTYLVDHRLGRTQDTRLKSAWYGAGARLKIDALNTALKMAA